MGTHPEKDPRTGHSILNQRLCHRRMWGFGARRGGRGRAVIGPRKILFHLTSPVGAILGTVLEITDYVNFLGSNRKSS